MTQCVACAVCVHFGTLQEGQYQVQLILYCITQLYCIVLTQTRFLVWLLEGAVSCWCELERITIYLCCQCAYCDITCTIKLTISIMLCSMNYFTFELVALVIQFKKCEPSARLHLPTKKLLKITARQSYAINNCATCFTIFFQLLLTNYYQ